MDFQEALGKINIELSNVVDEYWESQETMFKLLQTQPAFQSLPMKSEVFTRYGMMICSVAVDLAVTRLGYHDIARYPRFYIQLMDDLVERDNLLARDYNVTSQFLLNLRNNRFLMINHGDKYKTRVASLQDKLNTAKIDPKVKVDKSTLDPAIVEVLEEFKSLSWDSIDTNNILSYRISPIGRTPAFADTHNLSSLRYHAQKYLGLTPMVDELCTIRHYAIDPTTPEPEGFYTISDEGVFHFKGIGKPYTSSSDGQYLTRSMFIRSLVVEIYKVLTIHHGVVFGVYPRLNSITLVLPKTQSVIDAVDAVIPSEFTRKDPRES